ncbi:putative short-chain dehydrogenase/reductase family protein [Xylariales sp. PMI_506]|nr:putative short-chain dehydrogenase/reductase family protein [Xylariales sp. PMI_506]
MSLILKSQLCYKAQHPPRTIDLSNKVAIITGGNVGLGFESARQFLSLKLSHVVIASRSKDKGAAAASKLRTEFPGATVDVWSLDMASYDSIKAFVQRVESDLPHIDIVVLNAGLTKFTFDLVPSTGHEELMQVNYLSTMLLSTLLLPILKKRSAPGAPTRLSIVSSGTTELVAFTNIRESPLLKSFDNIKTAPAPGLEAYGTSKIMGHMFVSKLIDYVSSEDVIINLVDPGITRGTSFNRNTPRVLNALASPMMYTIARSVRDGASTYLDAVLVKGKESHGRFIMDWEVRPYAPIMYTPQGKEATERVWQETMEELKSFDIQHILESLKRS